MTKEDITEALKQAQAWDSVENLEYGLDTVIGDKGVRLSGGQRHRIVLARVLRASRSSSSRVKPQVLWITKARMLLGLHKPDGYLNRMLSVEQ